MRRRLSAIAITSALAGAALLAVLPSHPSATATTDISVVADQVNVGALRQQAEQLIADAKRLDQAGNHAAADRDRAQAAAIYQQIKAYTDAEGNNGPVWS
ncbi:hypothetical protein [Streptomyces sp. YGL11-2]|uniref:hypothetical protein n=1 Tax=Streptomyces sp. YGL11-2 TaxID=3414028 RepID=UPI003CFA5553